MSKRKRGTKLQFDIIDLMSKGMSRKEVSNKLGCSLRHVHDTMSDKALKQMYYERCNERIAEAVPGAIQRLISLAHDDSQQGSVQFAASKELINFSKLRELSTVEAPEIKVVVSYE